MSTIWHDEDIPALILATGGVPCTIDGVNGIALMDQPGALFSGDPARGLVIVEEPVLTIQTTAFPSAKVDSSVLIDGKFWTVRVREKEGDGGTTRLFLGPGAPVQIIIDGGGFDGTGGIGQSKDGGHFDGSGGVGSSIDGGGF